MLRSRLHNLVRLVLATALIALPDPAFARELKPETLAAFERYRTLTEARMEADRQSGHFLHIEGLPANRRAEIDAQVRRGEYYFEEMHTTDGDKKIAIPDGLVHHWLGLAFFPHVTLAQTKAVLGDYEHEKENYFPDVTQSHLISQNGNSAEVFLQFYSKTIVTTVFNVNFSTQISDYSATETQVRSCSTRVADVENIGTPSEHELPQADSRGYLWRLCDWWHIKEADGGVYLQVEAIELSRTVPFGFGWLINPLIHNVPRTFLSHLLSETQKAVEKSSAPHAENYSQPCSAMYSRICRASKLPFLEAAVSRMLA